MKKLIRKISREKKKSDSIQKEEVVLHEKPSFRRTMSTSDVEDKLSNKPSPLVPSSLKMGKRVVQGSKKRPSSIDLNFSKSIEHGVFSNPFNVKMEDSMPTGRPPLAPMPKYRPPRAPKSSQKETTGKDSDNASHENKEVKEKEPESQVNKKSGKEEDRGVSMVRAKMRSALSSGNLSMRPLVTNPFTPEKSVNLLQKHVGSSILTKESSDGAVKDKDNTQKSALLFTSDQEDVFLEKLSPMKRRMYLFSKSRKITGGRQGGDELFAISSSGDRSFNRTYDSGIVFSLQKMGKEFNSEHGKKGSKKSEEKALTFNKHYVNRLLKFFSEQDMFRNEIDDYDFLTKYPVNNMNILVQCKVMLRQKKRFSVEKVKLYVPMLFVEKNLGFSMISHISTHVGSKKEQEKEFKHLLELLILETSNFFFLKKLKFIQTKEKDMKVFIMKYKKVLILEPSLFLKVLRFIDFEDVENHIYDSSREKFKKVALSFADVLYILRMSENEKVRQFAIEMLKLQYSDDEMFLFLKPFVQRLKVELESKKEVEEEGKSALGNLFTYLAQRKPLLWSGINWELKVESEFGADALEVFRKNFILGENKNDNFSLLLQKQQQLSEFVCEIQEELEGFKEKRRKRLARLRQILSENEKKFEGIFQETKTNFFLPSNKKSIIGIDPQECYIWKSTKLPIKLAFKTKNSSEEDEFAVLFKKGDDLRQDQLILSVISFMNILLVRHELDLKIIIYQIMGTGKLNGLIEIVPNSFNLTEIYERFQSIVQFLRIFNPSHEEYKSAVNTFARSLAGYSVMTYLLGIGDRHLENMMVTTAGNFFHVDFSFIFGRDPKFKTPLRITTEMIDVLGGVNGTAFYEFSVYLCKAYNHLRYHHNIIISLLYSMSESRIPHVTVENIKKTVQRFMLDLTEKEARVHILKVLFKSLKSVVPKLNELFHKIAQGLRD